MEIKSQPRADVSFLPAEFFNRPADVVARDLIGCVLSTKFDGRITQGRIVETEAYTGPDDPASHSYGGRRTDRNSSMFLVYGTVYVYFIYGMHWCFNLVTGAEGYGAAVLVRALEPTRGSDTMRGRRKQTKVEVLCAGPGRLCQALGINGLHNGLKLNSAGISIIGVKSRPHGTDVGPRIGISRGKDMPLRFAESGSKWLSK